METVQLELRLPSRGEVTRETRLLDSAPEESFDRLTRLAARLLEAPTSLVTILDDDRQFFKSIKGLAEPWASRRETPLSHSFCQHVVASGKPLVVDDARQVPLLQDNLAIPEIGVIAYIGVPLTVKNVPFGVLCVIDGHSRHWSDSDLSTLNDLAAMVMDEIELRQRGFELERMVERQNEFLGVAAHDMRSPLTVAYGYAKLLAHPRSQLPEKQQKMAQAVCESCELLTRLTDDLVDLEALRTGRVQLDRAPIDPLRVVARSLELHRALAAEKQIEIELRHPSSPVTLTADALKLEQMLNNLLDNAVRYSPANTRITLSLELGERLTIKVADQGPGIAPERIPTLFTAFQPRERNQPRTGRLGLAIVERIAQAHGGEVRVETRPGQGSTFIVELPL